MNPRCFFANPDFNEYVRLLGRLHRLIRQQRDESDEGEAMRDAMDGPGDALSEDEVRAAREISADLYTINGNHGPVPSRPAPPPDVPKGVLEAITRHDALHALTLLREHADEIPAPTLANLRGEAFAAAGLSEIAADFFEHAKRMTPVSNTTFGD
jgi:hypothetical protein